ncbi:Zn-dependent protease with chaperone function [Halorubrum alkaliphilum]|uniref:Zn-dependent protease with chaperone function n=1 Tax=Halorubrum alkaliphilum TaxID=261290 RepID=A0A8T4GDT2_9EURY|nr:peptidase [Halorubrum alkaliphilum]MBP1921810.1 Zn-dependent protease with chaperone function [Halorubrum alkaliphilum]
MLTVAFLVGVVVVAFLAVEVGPLVVNDRFRDLREPTDPERAALDALRETAGLDVDRVAIVETSGDESVDVAVRGPPRRRVLFVTDYVLDELDEDTAVGLLAAEAGRVDTYYGEFRAVSVAAVVGILAAIVATVVPFGSGFTAVIVVGVASFWVGRRVQYVADDRAADAVGAARVADAFEAVAALRGVDPETGDWSTWFEVQPPLGDRIAALRERSGE